MKYFLPYLVACLIIASPLYSMEEETYSHNTYKGQEINPVSLITMAPQMPSPLKERVKECVNKYRDFITELVTTPHPLTHENRKQKTQSNFAIIKQYEDKGEVKNLGNFNYVLRFRDYPEFVMPINRWGSRVAYWIYSSGEGNPLTPGFNADATNCAAFEYLPSYQHCSRVAHYLRLKEIMEKNNFKSLKTTPTYLQHIPGKPKELSDENYVVIQEWIDGLHTIKKLKDKSYIIKKDISLSALKEIHEATIYAALWDMHAKLSVDGKNPYYYIVYLEEPMTHKQKYFYFRGEEGRRKYVEDVILALERVAKMLAEIPEQLERWKKLTEEHKGFKRYCDEYNMYPDFSEEHLKEDM